MWHVHVCPRMSHEVLSYQLPMEQLRMSSLSFDKFVKDDGRLVPDWHQDVEKPLTCSMRPHFVERWQAVEEFREREREDNFLRYFFGQRVS